MAPAVPPKHQSAHFVSYPNCPDLHTHRYIIRHSQVVALEIGIDFSLETYCKTFSQGPSRGSVCLLCLACHDCYTNSRILIKSLFGLEIKRQLLHREGVDWIILRDHQVGILQILSLYSEHYCKFVVTKVALILTNKLCNMCLTVMAH